MNTAVGSFADLRGIAEGDGEEQGGNGQGQNQDVGEALHGEFSREEGWSRRSAEGGASRRHVALGQAAGRPVSQFLEEAELHLFAEIGVDAGEHITVEGAGTVPDVTEEEEQGEGGMAEGEPATG